MMNLLDFCVFAGAFGVSAFAIGATIVPKWERIGAALAGRQTVDRPLETLVRAERRIAVRVWASTPRAPSARWRAAA